MPSLGQMLVGEKVISAKQLDEAIQSQVIFGGRLGTNLVELGFIDEQMLTKFLARKHGVPTVNWTQLNRIKPAVLKLFNKNLAKRCEAFPLKVEGKDIYVVMSDPGNLEAVQEINFATGKKVKPLVLPEIRVFDLLTRFYNIGRELRYINLAMMYQVKEEKKKPEQEAPEGPPAGISEREWKEREEVRKKIDFKGGQDLLGEDEFMSMTNQQFAQQLGYQEGEGPGPAPQPGPAAPPPAAPPAPSAAPPMPAEPKPAAPVQPAPPPAAPAPPPAAMPRAPVARKPGVSPHKEIAQSLYSLLMKRGVSQYIAKETLQEFLKLFVKSQLKNDVLSMNYLANWLIIEANAPVEWLEQVLTEFKGIAKEIEVEALLPGESAPVKPPKPAPAVPPPPKPAPPPAEVVEEAEVMEEVEELPAAALEPVAPSPPPSAPPAAKEPAPPTAEVKQPAPPAPATPAAPPAAEAPAAGKSAAAPEGAAQVLELGMEDLVSAEEAEAYVPEEGPEEEAEEAAYVQLTLEEAREKLLKEVADRADISRIVLGFAMGFFRRSLLFTVRNETLYGWDGHGPGIKADMVESIMLPLTDPSVFQLVNLTKSFFLGPVQPGPVNERFLKLLGGQQPNNVFIIPVVVNEKVVYILYGDNGGGEFVPPNAPELQILAYQIPRALEMLIKRKKAQQPAA